MPLIRSAWKTRRQEAPLDDYILILPDEQFIVSLSNLRMDRWAVWGCWIREEADAVVYTALKISTEWRAESYRMENGMLRWENKTGISFWTPIEEAEIPPEWMERVWKFVSHMGDFSPPEYPNPG